MNNLQLRNGVLIPSVGLGTWQVSDEDVTRCVLHALKCGYRHIDTAVAYGNELGIGLALKQSGLKREEYFITSKIPAEVKTYEGAVITIKESLKSLGLEYLDLMLIHAPRPWSEMGGSFTNHYYEENLQVWKALEEAKEAGLIRAIGVSNFWFDDLENIINNSKVVPFVNQFCVNPSYTNMDLINYCKERGILVEAYSPIGTGRMLTNEYAKQLASKYGVGVANICIKYALSLGLVALPKSTHEEYIENNLQLDFELTEEEIKKLGGF